MAVYGYARVSTREQNLDRQMDALRAFGVAKGRIFADKASGKDFERAEYRRLLGRLGPGDVVAVASIDRLGRDYGEIQEQWRFITKDLGADMVVLDMPLLDTRATPEGITGAFIADMVLQVLAYVAQVEREKIRQRQREGIEAAKRRGTEFGRRKIAVPRDFADVLACVDGGLMTRAQAARKLGVSVSTFDRWKREAADALENGPEGD